MMDIKKELENIFNDPLLDISDKEAELFSFPDDMKKAMAGKNKADYVAQRKVCADFGMYRPLFHKVHQELKQGKRSLVRISKTINLQVGHYYVIDGQLLLLESILDRRTSSNFLPDGRTRCIYENGTESDILLQTLRKSVVGNGFAVTELEEESESKFFTQSDITDEDKATGYIYVLSSLSKDPAISNQQNLYKIGFSTNTVEERIANAEHEPTYLMAPVKIVATYRVVNLHSQKFENLIHQFLKAVQFHVTVTDDNGELHEPKEWFVVPIHIINSIIEKTMNGSIIHYTYNPDLQCMEYRR